jgi:hypothetical protein
MLSLDHCQSWNFAGTFERAVEGDEKHTVTEAGTIRLVKAWARVASHGDLLDDDLKKRGWDGKLRVAVYCSCEKAEDLIKDGPAEIQSGFVSDLTALIRRASAWIQETRHLAGRLPRVIGIHGLKFAPTGNFNRTTHGQPKTTPFDDGPRIMWTSQAENAGRRAADIERGIEPYAIRTPAIVNEIMKKLNQADASPEAREIAAGFVNFAWGAVKALENPVAKFDDWNTETGYFPGTDEIGRAADRLRVYWNALMPLAKTAAEGVKKAMDNYIKADAEAKTAPKTNDDDVAK